MSPPTKRMKFAKPVASIEDLPLEMINELFKYLHLKDLAACSRVNKRWHSIYSNFKLYSLVVTDASDAALRWYDTKQTMREEDQCGLKAFNHMPCKLLWDLKHLALFGWSEFVLDKLNYSQQLVHLEIGSIYWNVTKHLTLPQLKVLVVHFNTHCALSIDAPLLSTLVHRKSIGRGGANWLNVQQPETIRKLDTDIIDPRWLAQFKGVECLATRNRQALSKTTLLLLPALRELHYDQVINWLFEDESHRGPGILDRVKLTLNEFLNEAKKLRGSDFRFRFAGFQLTNAMLSQIDNDVQFDEESGQEYVLDEYFYLKYYHLIEPGALDFLSIIDYTRLLRNVTGEFPRCFSQKFTGIKWVNASAEVPDADHFLRFLKSLRSLRNLDLENTRLGQEFYDQLPASIPSLIKLILYEGYCEDGLHLDFDFIGRLSRLSYLHIDPVLSSESLPSFVRSLGRLENGCFTVKTIDPLKEDHLNFEISKDFAGWTISKVNREFREKIAIPILSENLEKILSFFKRRPSSFIPL